MNINNMKLNLIFFFFVLSIVSFSTAKLSDIGPQYPGVRAMGMGGAITAVTDGHEALYYNPAALNLFLDYFEVSTSLPTILSSSVMDLADFALNNQDIGDPDKITPGILENLNKIDGKWSVFGVYPEAAINTRNFGVGFFSTLPPHIMVESGVLIPKLGLGGVSDFVLVSGIAKRVNHNISLGVTAKYIYRITMDDKILTFSDTKGMADKLVEKDPNAFWELAELKQGIGFDFGSIMHMGAFRIGLVIQDFPTYLSGGLLHPRFNLGLAYKVLPLMEFEYIDEVTLALDIDDMAGSQHFFLRTHAGAEIISNVFHARVGLNQGYPTFGAGVKFGVFAFDYVNYTYENIIYENGQFPGQVPVNIHMFQLNFFLRI